MRLAAAGMAWLRVWDVLPDIDLFAGDRQHPGEVGSYIGALVIYSAITGISPVGMDSDVCYGAPTCVPAANLGAVQDAAWAQHLDTGRRFGPGS